MTITTINPYPKEIEDEVSGISVPNDRYRDWQAGYEAGYEDAISDSLLPPSKDLSVLTAFLIVPPSFPQKEVRDGFL